MADCARNLEDALELAELAERMVRTRLCREHTEHDPAQIEREVRAWLRDRGQRPHSPARDDRTRPQDRVDLGALFAVADDTTLKLTREALRLVTERGYARGRDLAADLDAALAELN